MLHSLINQRVGRYIIQELLGRGGMGAVYRARDAALQRDVALKILYPQYSDDESLAERFKREAIMAASLEHPNIVPIYDVGEQDGMAYMAMKMLHGRPLADILNERGSLPIAELLPILEQIASALDYAHNKGVIHRDIKPGNIILELPRGATIAPPPAATASATATGVGTPPALHQASTAGPLPPTTIAILTDFGIAKSLDAPGMTTTGAMLGTPDYMAPEQIAGGTVDRRADVYALGVMVYRALTGQRPFGGTTQDVLMGHLKIMPEDPSFLNHQVAPALDPVIKRAMAKTPQGRFDTAGAFVRALRTAVEGKAMPVVPPPNAPIAEQPTRVNTPRQGTVVPQQSQPTTPAPREVLARPAQTARPITQPPRQGNRSGWMIAAMGLALLAALGMIGYGAATLLANQSPLPTAAVATATQAIVAAASQEATASSTEGTVTTTATAEAPSPSPEQPVTTATVPVIIITATSAPATHTTRPTNPPTRAVPPTDTVAPPTQTPVPPTATSPPPTETPLPPSATPTEIACNTDLLRQGSGFRVLYENEVAVRGRIGCPTGNETAIDIADQIFERGTMYWWPTRDTVYAMPETQGQSGTYQSFSKSEAAALPDPPEQVDPLMNRSGGFTRVFYARSDIREAIGGPITAERGTNGAFQQFENGFMIYSPANSNVRGKTIYVLYNDGAFRRYDDLNPN